MHVLFVHQNYPAQFGQIANRLATSHGYRCTFASAQPGNQTGPVERIRYRTRGGATSGTHYCSRTFENQVWNSAGLFEALHNRPDIQPDLVVGHCGFVSTLYLRELYDCPIINYFELFYRLENSDFEFRKDLPPSPVRDRLRARTRNAMILLDLENCNAGYAPTRWQHSRLPAEFQHKVEVIFDGIDTEFWRPIEMPDRRLGTWVFPADKKIVTYVSRGMESLRGFDIFMQFADELSRQRDDVMFVVAGEDRVAYGGDSRFTGGQSFKQWVIDKGRFDLSRFAFLGRVSPTDLARLFALSDLHVYLTAPFVLSWSLMNAMSCGCTIMASDTAPVREMIRQDENGLLVDFFDVEHMVDTAQAVLDCPTKYERLGQTSRELVLSEYSVEECLPKLIELFERSVGGSTGE